MTYGRAYERQHNQGIFKEFDLLAKFHSCDTNELLDNSDKRQTSASELLCGAKH